VYVDRSVTNNYNGPPRGDDGEAVVVETPHPKNWFLRHWKRLAVVGVVGVIVFSTLESQHGTTPPQSGYTPPQSGQVGNGINGTYVPPSPPSNPAPQPNHQPPHFVGDSTATTGGGQIPTAKRQTDGTVNFTFNLHNNGPVATSATFRIVNVANGVSVTFNSPNGFSCGNDQNGSQVIPLVSGINAQCPQVAQDGEVGFMPVNGNAPNGKYRVIATANGSKVVDNVPNSSMTLSN
jgi:hypothetical protein